MPEIDADLFQVLALALLFLCLLSLLATLSVLSGIKKQLESRGAGDTAAAPEQSAYGYQAPATTAYDAPQTYSAPVPQAQPQEVSTGFVPMAEATSAQAQPAAAAPSGGLRGDEPEEQPFERDGRWWFKRGGELLVYDEGTGQWVAAPNSGTTLSGTIGTIGPAPVAGSETAVVPRTDAGEGWKCTSCGAVNGSTATSCRMCFAPR